MFAFINKEPLVFLLKRIWRFLGEYKKHFIVMLFLSGAANVTYLISPILFGKLINEVQLYGLQNIGIVSALILGFIGIEIVGRAFGWPGGLLEMYNSFRVDRNYKKFLYQGVFSLPLSWHSDHDSGDVIDKINKSTAALFDASKNVSTFLYVWIRVIGTTIALMYFSVSLGLITLGLLVASLVIIFLFDKKMVPQYKAINEIENKASAKVFDSLSNITTVKVLGIEGSVLSSVMSSSWASFSLFKLNNKWIEAKWGVGGVLFSVVVSIPLLFYVWSEYRTTGIVLVGTLSTLYLYLSNLIGVYHTFTSMYSNMILDKARVQNVENIEAEFTKLSRLNKKEFKNWSTIEITKLNFAYDAGRDHKEFSDFKFTLERGEKIAFIGESGSGKSTLLKILHGMYDTASAKVSIDGATPIATNFADLDLESTLVPQEPEVFSASIRENITLLLDFDDEAIRQASDAAMFTDVIEQLPKKIESVVNEKGVNLSGGQKQRLALTRALLFSKDKKIMLLDESTSSVDSVNEVKIYKNIFENFRDATIIASIHKMNLLKYFDRIVILEKGTIRAEGSFDELLARDAEFKKSWDEFVLSHKGEEN